MTTSDAIGYNTQVTPTSSIECNKSAGNLVIFECFMLDSVYNLGLPCVPPLILTTAAMTPDKRCLFVIDTLKWGVVVAGLVRKRTSVTATSCRVR